METAIAALAATLASVREDGRALVRARMEAVFAVHASHRRSAENLLHYVALRRRDVRTLQAALAELGLSSLGRCESHVAATLDAVGRALAALGGSPVPTPDAAVLTAGEGQALLAWNTERLLGKEPERRDVRILVTAPEELARDPSLANALVTAGTDALRVNCAHDDDAAWAAMIAAFRASARASGRTLPVLMDLPGPKLRTAGLPEGRHASRSARQQGRRENARCSTYPVTHLAVVHRRARDMPTTALNRRASSARRR